MQKYAWAAVGIGWTFYIAGLYPIALAFFVLSILINAGHYGGVLNKKLEGRKAKAIETAKVDGRTNKEWYDLIKLMGKEEYEKLSRPALDGLEESQYGWDAKRLLGSEYDKLMREWYPEKHCKYCWKLDCKQNCDAYWAGVPTTIKTRGSKYGNFCLDCGSSLCSGNCRLYAKSQRVDRITTGNTTKVHMRSDGVYVERKDGALERVHQHTPTKPSISVTEVVFVDRPGVKKYRIRHGGKEYMATQRQVSDFQRYKGLPSDGIVGPKTREVLSAYLSAGNPWPVSQGRLQSQEARKLAAELVKWKNDAEEMKKELRRQEMRYKKNYGGDLEW